MIPAPDLPTALALLALEPALGGLALGDAEDGLLAACAAALAAERGPDARVLRLPVQADPAALLGGLDLAATLHSGRRTMRPGLLAAHDGGVLLLPDADLLPPELAGPLTTALHRQAVVLERDGISAHLSARLLLMTALPTATAPRYPAILDRAGLWLNSGLPAAADATHAAVSTLYFPLGTAPVVLGIPYPALAAARARLPDVKIADGQIAALAAMAGRLGIAGLRADYLATRAACAGAALAGRTAVADADLELAAALVLLPRATVLPAPPRSDSPPPSPPPDAPVPDAEDQSPRAGQNPDEPPAPPDGPPAAIQNPNPRIDAERLIAAAAAWLPPHLPAPPAGRVRPGGAPGAGGAGRAGAGAQRPASAHHGRPGPARAAARRPPGATLDLAGTLEAAARRGIVAPPPDTAGPSSGAAPGARLRIQVTDLRWRVPQAPPGILFLLAVDASGSMARNRLGPAKGAALLLLERAYRRRDRVALVAFRGPQAAALLPPTRSVARARRLLESLPAGGGTPLASALALTWDLAARAAQTGAPHTVLVLLTDGRANVPLAGPPTPAHLAAEVAALAARWAGRVAAGSAAVLVVDTRLRYLGDGAAPALAAALGGRYLYLPQATAAAVGAAAEAAARALRR